MQHFSSLRCYLKSMVLQPPNMVPCLENKECHQCHLTSTLVICVNTLRAFSKQQPLCRCDCDTNKQNHRMITAPRTGRQFSHRVVKLKTLIDKKCTCVLRAACITTKLQLPGLGKFQSASCLYFKTDLKLTLGFWGV